MPARSILSVTIVALAAVCAQCVRVNSGCLPGDAVCAPITHLLPYILYTTRPTPPSGNVLSAVRISEEIGGFSGFLADQDAFGQGISVPGDLNGDGMPDFVVGAIRDDDNQPNSGALYVLFLNTDGTVASQQKISGLQGGLTTVPDNAENFGARTHPIGDRNGDGVPDLLVSGARRNDGGNDRGAFYELWLNPDGSVAGERVYSELSGNLPFALEDQDRFGADLVVLGDLNQDGVDDRAVGAIFDDDLNSNSGAVYILFMQPDYNIQSAQKISNLEGGFDGELLDEDRFGSALAAIGDLDLDGIPDLAAGTFDDTGGADSGAIYILFLNRDGTVKSQQKIIPGQAGLTADIETDDRFAFSLAAPGDLNNDGIPDLIAGATRDDDGGTDRGAVYFLYMNRNGTVQSQQKISQTNFPLPLLDQDAFGTTIGLPGDLNGDNVPDLIVGADGTDGAGLNRGAAYVVFLEGAY